MPRVNLLAEQNGNTAYNNASGTLPGGSFGSRYGVPESGKRSDDVGWVMASGEAAFKKGGYADSEPFTSSMWPDGSSYWYEETARGDPISGAPGDVEDAVYYGEYIYLTIGQDLYEYDMITQEYTLLQANAHSAPSGVAADDNGNIYVSRRGIESDGGQFAVYDTDNDTYTSLSDPQRSVMSIAHYDGAIYGARWRLNQGDYIPVEYDIGSDSWTDITDPFGDNIEDYGVAPGGDGNVYYLGGRDENDNELDTVYYYDPGSGTVGSFFPLPEPAREVSAEYAGGGVIYMLVDAGSGPVGDIEVWEYQNNSVTVIESDIDPGSSFDFGMAARPDPGSRGAP